MGSRKYHPGVLPQSHVMGVNPSASALTRSFANNALSGFFAASFALASSVITLHAFQSTHAIQVKPNTFSWLVGFSVGVDATPSPVDLMSDQEDRYKEMVARALAQASSFTGLKGRRIGQSEVSSVHTERLKVSRPHPLPVPFPKSYYRALSEHEARVRDRQKLLEMAPLQAIEVVHERWASQRELNAMQAAHDTIQNQFQVAMNASFQEKPEVLARENDQVLSSHSKKDSHSQQLVVSQKRVAQESAFEYSKADQKNRIQNKSASKPELAAQFAKPSERVQLDQGPVLSPLPVHLAVTSPRKELAKESTKPLIALNENLSKESRKELPDWMTESKFKSLMVQLGVKESDVLASKGALPVESTAPISVIEQGSQQAIVVGKQLAKNESVEHQLVSQGGGKILIKKILSQSSSAPDVLAQVERSQSAADQLVPSASNADSAASATPVQRVRVSSQQSLMASWAPPTEASEKSHPISSGSKSSEKESFPPAEGAAFVKAFDFSVPVDEAVFPRVVSYEGEKSSSAGGWVVHRAEDHHDTLSWVNFKEERPIPLLSRNSLMAIDLEVKRRKEKDLSASDLQLPHYGVVMGRLQEGWNLEFSGRSEPVIYFDSNRNILKNKGSAKKDRYFVFPRAELGAHLVYLTEVGTGRSTAVAFPVLEDTTTYLDFLDSPTLRDLVGTLRFGSNPKVRGLREANLRVVGQTKALARTNSFGEFLIPDVLTFGDYPVYVEVDHHKGNLHRYRVLPRQMEDKVTFHWFRSEEIFNWIGQVKGGQLLGTQSTGLILGSFKGLQSLHSQSYLFPSVSTLQDESDALPEVYSQREDGQLVVKEPLNKKNSRMVSVEAPETGVISELKVGNEVVWSEFVIPSPGVISVLGPY